jgi:hydrogen peroxide-dependent heme synthase
VTTELTGEPQGEDDPAAGTPPDEAGWWVLHLFYKATTAAQRGPIELAIKECQSAEHQVITATLYGHKADFAVMAIGPSPDVLRALQTHLRLAGLEAVYSYTSLTELSEYASGLPDAMRRARLRPVLPPDAMPAFCFYPMSKRRDGDDNWYRLGHDARDELMRAHGAVGRRFRGRVLQLVTGSTGLDDFEWGVTLFGRSHDDIKACVYEMRFDEASARYAEFGPFLVGSVATPDAVLNEIGIL